MPKTAIITCRAKEGKEEEVKQALTQLISPSRAEEGCLDYHIVQSSDDPRVFMGYLLYKDEDTFNKHEASSHIVNFREKQAPALLEGEPKIKDWRELG